MKLNRELSGGIVLAVASAISLPASAINILENGDFATGRVTPWEFGAWEGSRASIAVNEDRACVEVVNPGADTWAIQLRQNNLILVDGHTYTLSADVWTSSPISLRVDGSDETGGYNFHFGEEFELPATGLSGTPQSISAVYLNERDTETGKFGFHLGQGLVPAGTTVCVSNVVLDDPDAILPDRPENLPLTMVRVNQQGYLPALEKRAVYVLGDNDASNTTTARSWSLVKNPGGTVVASGQTEAFGLDPASQDQLHSIDFSSYTGTGDEFVLRVSPLGGGAAFESMPFAINESIYAQMQYDALAYFYHNRASTPILASVVGEEHARDAGHPDTAVETYDCIGENANPDGCRTADVRGGWYDAGDHGKYVVNGGISAWTMLNQFERSMYAGSNSADFADGAMALPAAEQSNGIPDILDEAAWEIEWFLRMQVPAGYPNAGMVYHKMHTSGWTAIPTLPADDDGLRVIQPVSTTATLNMAAVAAQCARIYEGYNSNLADRCLSAARTAYDAATANPNIAAPLNEIDGAGGYGDRSAADEFYWAATELYLTTGEGKYLSDMQASGFHGQIFLGQADPDFEIPLDSMGWPKTELLGVISMSLLEGEYVRNPTLKTQAREYLSERADAYVAESEAQGYGLPFRGQNAFWGSNSAVINNMILIALANDFACGAEPKYLNTLQNGMNYLLGENPMDQSYVTGYGERPLREPHHRFWAKAASNAFPAPPPGALSGGPNTGLEDPIAAVDLDGCAPLKCFLDEIESWSTNEITINWNAPFAWVTAYMNEQSSAAGRAALCDGVSPEPEPEPEPDPEPDPDDGKTGGALNLLHWLALIGCLGVYRSRRQ